ncbi:MAG: CarD family transcriptional regulator [Myxococcota bacterium]
MEFEIGDEVVVSGCGVGEVEAIEAVTLAGDETEMYRIALRDGGMRTWIPVERLVAPDVVADVRPVMSADAADEALACIQGQEAPEKRGNWRRRQLRYQQTLKDNDPQELATLLGELAAVRKNHTLSFQERRLFDRLKDLVLAEICLAQGLARDELEATLAPTLNAA